MKISFYFFAFAILALNNVHAGDDASGHISYSTDLSLPYTKYTMSQKDKAWSNSLIKRLKYKGPVVHFVKTSLPLNKEGKKVKGAIYQALEKPKFFYVTNGDVMLEIGEKWPYSPGVGGFDMWSPKSRNFIVAVNMSGGVPFLSGTPVIKGKIMWKGDEFTRIK